MNSHIVLTFVNTAGNQSQCKLFQIQLHEKKIYFSLNTETKTKRFLISFVHLVFVKQINHLEVTRSKQKKEKKTKIFTIATSSLQRCSQKKIK